MVRLAQFEEKEREHLLNLPCPRYETNPFVTGVLLSNARIALISTAGLHCREDRPFGVGETGYRLIPLTCGANELVMSHISTNFDRTGFQNDVNVVFPIDRLRELAEQGFIGGLARFHYSFMGATDPQQMETEARQLSVILKKDGVDAVVLVPV